MADRPAHVFTIPPAAPFLPTLATSIVDGTLVPGTDYRADPLALADLTVFLPTRRAARAFGRALSDALGGGTVILPRIRPLGDVEEDPVDAVADPAGLDLPPAMPPADRLVGLATLVAQWRRFVTADRTLTPSGQPIAVPGSAADALHLSADLLALIDQGAAEGIEWTKLGSLVPEDHAAWWQLTLTFLTIATEVWPAHLAERGLIDPVDRRTRLTLAIAERMRREGTRGPVIAAGSTGSVPATATLLAVIARLPQGAVVLPGLDRSLDPETFASLAPDAGPGVPSHPQAAMARLLQVIGAGRDDVVDLGATTAAAAKRFSIVSEALRPAETTHLWPGAVARLDTDPVGTAAALGGLSLVTAANEAEEALAVAVALRETLETPDATAALVTPDRGLARRVCTELARFGVTAEDSAGEPLARTRTGVLALLVAEVAAEGAPPDKVVALLKHPLARFALPADRVGPAARALELAVLRGPRLAAGTEAIAKAAAGTCKSVRETVDVADPAARLTEEDAADGRRLAWALHDALAPLEALAGLGAVQGAIPLKQAVATLVAAVRAVARGGADEDEALFAGPAGGVFAELVTDHLDAREEGLAIAPRDLPAVLAALMADRSVRRPVPASRIAILDRWRRACSASTGWCSAASTRASGRLRPTPVPGCRDRCGPPSPSPRRSSASASPPMISCRASAPATW